MLHVQILELTNKDIFFYLASKYFTSDLLQRCYVWAPARGTSSPCGHKTNFPKFALVGLETYLCCIHHLLGDLVLHYLRLFLLSNAEGNGMKSTWSTGPGSAHLR